MSATEAFTTLKTYFETRPAAKRAMSVLPENVEIGITIGDMVECALMKKDGQPLVEQRAANHPDFIFRIRPESVYVLSSQPSDEIGEIAVAIFKEILAGNISVRFLGSLTSLMSNGYFDMLKLGGSRVAQFLTTQGLTGVTTILRTIKKMRG